MKVWRVVLLVVTLAAVAVVLVTGYFEASGRIRLPWPAMYRQLHFGGDRLGVLRSEPLREVSPYLQAIGGLLSQSLAGVLLLYVAPSRLRRLADAFSPGLVPPLRFLVVGGVLAVALGAVAALASFYVYTFPVPFLLIGVFLVAAMVGGVALAFAFGRGLLRRAGWAGGSPILALVLGTLLLYALTRIPYLAGATVVLIGLTGAGAALSTRFGGRAAWSLEPLQEESVS